MPDFSIGVDLGGTNLRIAAVERSGSLLEKISLTTKTSLGREFVIDEMCDTIRHISQRHERGGTLLGIGIGVPGIIDIRTGFIREVPNLPGWSDTHVQSEIERRLGAKVVIDNDANVAALGEQWLGAGRHLKDLAIFTLGTGVGGGTVLNGTIWRGMTGMAGEFGHIVVEPDGVPCTCGSRGCLEQYASATGIMRMAREAIGSGIAPGMEKAANSAEFTPRSVYALASHGDRPARKIFETVGRTLGIAVSDMVNILNLPMYVIGGGVASSWDAFAPALLEEVRYRSIVLTATALHSDSPEAHVKALDEGKTVIARAALGSDSGLYGAARLPMIAA
jgi:glucokinase